MTRPHKPSKRKHRKTCERKVKHPTREEASAAARLYPDVEAYQCMWCRFWHTGHRWSGK